MKIKMKDKVLNILPSLTKKLRKFSIKRKDQLLRHLKNVENDRLFTAFYTLDTKSD